MANLCRRLRIRTASGCSRSRLFCSHLLPSFLLFLYFLHGLLRSRGFDRVGPYRCKRTRRGRCGGRRRRCLFGRGMAGSTNLRGRKAPRSCECLRVVGWLRRGLSGNRPRNPLPLPLSSFLHLLLLRLALLLALDLLGVAQVLLVEVPCHQRQRIRRARLAKAMLPGRVEVLQRPRLVIEREVAAPQRVIPGTERDRPSLLDLGVELAGGANPECCGLTMSPFGLIPLCPAYSNHVDVTIDTLMKELE